MRVKLYTAPRPLAGVHVTSRLPHSGHNARGYQKTRSQCSQRGSSSVPSAVASQNAAVSEVTSGTGVGSGSLISAVLPPSCVLAAEHECGAPHAGGQRSAGAVRDRERAVGDLHGGVGLAAQLAHCFDDLGHASAVARVVVAQPAAVGVERKLAVGRNEGAVEHEAPSFSLLAEAEILEAHEDRDG